MASESGIAITQIWHRTDGSTMAYTVKAPFISAIMNGALQCKVAYGVYSPNGKPRYHYGYDVSTKGGDKHVFATAAGKVIMSTIVPQGSGDKTWEWGNFVCILPISGYRHYYCHLASRAVSVGQTVNAGDPIGVMGKTGNAAHDDQGEHVHYEVRKSPYGTYDSVDPTPWLGMLNLQGWVDFKKQGGQDMGKMYCFDITEAEKGKLEIYRSADNNDAFSPARKLPAGKSIILAEVTIKNMPNGLSHRGLYIQLEKTGERVYTACGLGIGEIVQNEVQTVLDRFYPASAGGDSGVSQAVYDAVRADRDAQKAAKEAAQKRVNDGLTAARQTVKMLEE